MVRQTRTKNKATHPAAPVMTEAAKVKAGITPAKPRAKRMMKDAMIQELEARIAQLEKPADWHPSKEPLFTRSGSSGGDGATTDPDSDEDTPVSGKRSRQSHNQRALKHTKTYELFTDVRSTIRNKPSGLANSWYNIATASPPHQTAPQIYDYSPGPPAFYTASPPSMTQHQPVSTQSAKSFFPQGRYGSMDISLMTTPSIPDPSLSAPFAQQLQPI